MKLEKNIGYQSKPQMKPSMRYSLFFDSVHTQLQIKKIAIVLP